MRVTGVERCRFVSGPILAPTFCLGCCRPCCDSLFVVAKLVQHGRVFDKDGVLNDGTWHGTWWAKTCKCHWRRKFLRVLWG